MAPFTSPAITALLELSLRLHFPLHVRDKTGAKVLIQFSLLSKPSRSLLTSCFFFFNGVKDLVGDVKDGGCLILDHQFRMDLTYFSDDFDFNLVTPS